MKICVVCDVLGEENNGTTIAAMNLIRSLKAKGHDVRVVCPDNKLYRGKEGFYMLPVLKFPKALQDIVDKNNVVIGRAKKSVFKEAMEDADLVHVMFPLFIGPKAAKYAKKKLNKPLTVGFHAQAENVSAHFFGLMNSDKENRSIYKHYWKKSYKYADAIHYPTQFIRDTFEEVVGPTPGYVISNGVQSCFGPKKVEKPEKLKNKKVILFTGRISKEKSHHILVEAVAKSKYKNDIQLIFAGQGPREEEVMNLAKKLQLPNLPMIKFFTHDQLIDVINYADLYVHAAEVEIEAISCLEAIKCGQVPVIANSKKSATKAFALDERSLFEVNNPDDLAKKIDYWFDNPEEYKKMKEKYAKSSVQFDFETCMNKMEDMIKETIEKVNSKNSK